MIAAIKSSIAALIGNRNLGRYDYFSKPRLKRVWGGAFNGQQFRRKIFQELCAENAFKLIVETGAFRGNTTEFMSQQMIPVMSVEYDERLFGYVETRFVFNQRVEVFQNDSRRFLRELRVNQEIPRDGVFFYLDAHWSSDLPLAEELAIIFSYWRQSVVMIDDFEVPGTDYAYDDYGIDATLNLAYLAKINGAHAYKIYFPAVDDTQESGAKRGCVVLCNDAATAQRLDRCKTLRRHLPNKN